MAMRSRGVEIVPVWSPDATVVFDQGSSSSEIAKELRNHNIRWVMISLIVNLDSLKSQSPLYEELMKTTPWRVSESGKFALFYLGDGDGG